MTPDEYLKAIEKERRLDPRAFAMKVKAFKFFDTDQITQKTIIKYVSYMLSYHNTL